MGARAVVAVSESSRPAHAGHEPDLLEMLSRVDVHACRCLAVAGPEDRAQVMGALLLAMAPKAVAIHVEVTEGAPSPTWKDVVAPLLREVGLAFPPLPTTDRPPDFWIDVDRVVDEPGASPRVTVRVGDPFDVAAPLGLLRRGPKLLPSDRGADDVEQRWRFAIGWMRSLSQAFMTRASNDASDGF